MIFPLSINYIGYDNIDVSPFDILRGAAANNFYEVRSALQQDPRCIMNRDRRGRTAPHLAAERGYLEMLKFLSEQPMCDLTIQDDRNRDVFDAASEAANPEIDRFIASKLYPDILPSPL